MEGEPSSTENPVSSISEMSELVEAMIDKLDMISDCSSSSEASAGTMNEGLDVSYASKASVAAPSSGEPKRIGSGSKSEIPAISKRPLKLLDLPVDVLKEIIREVRCSEAL